MRVPAETPYDRTVNVCAAFCPDCPYARQYDPRLSHDVNTAVIGGGILPGEAIINCLVEKRPNETVVVYMDAPMNVAAARRANVPEIVDDVSGDADYFYDLVGSCENIGECALRREGFSPYAYSEDEERTWSDRALE